MSFAVSQIDHVEVFVHDIEASIGWYERVLGLKVFHSWDGDPVMIGLRDASKLALFKGSVSAKNVGLGESNSVLRWHRVAWRTDEAGFEKAQKHLKSCDVDFEGPMDHGLSCSIYFHDPDGNPLEITYYR